MVSLSSSIHEIAKNMQMSPLTRLFLPKTSCMKVERLTAQAVRIELQESAHSVRRAEESIPFVGEHGMMLLGMVPGLGVWA